MENDLTGPWINYVRLTVEIAPGKTVAVVAPVSQESPPEAHIMAVRQVCDIMEQKIEEGAINEWHPY